MRDGNLGGKLVMQKTFYFLKEMGVKVPFNFRWAQMGPYSFELANVMERTSSRGYAPYTGEYQYIGNNFRNIPELNVPNSIGLFFKQMDKFAKKQGLNQIFFYETAASLHFLYKYNNLQKSDDAFARLRALKANRMDLLEPSLEPAWHFLAKKKLIDDEMAAEELF